MLQEPTLAWHVARCDCATYGLDVPYLGESNGLLCHILS